MQRGTFLITTIFLLLTACAPAEFSTPASSWRYSHLRALDPVDAPHPASDLIALYTRTTTYDFQIRLDLLDLPDTAHSDIYIALDFVPGGKTELPIAAKSSSPWDLLLVIPSAGPPTLSESQSRTSNLSQSLPAEEGSAILPLPRVVRDHVLDTIVISLNAHLLPKQSGAFFIEAYTTPPGSAVVEDTIQAVSSDALPPGRAPLLLTFWNALPAHTPAQALRRWDAAHTGPLGRRHGLKHLVEAAQRHQVPITLLDLKSPLSLSALELLEGTSQIKHLAANDLVTIPDAWPMAYFGPLPTWVNQKMASTSREISGGFGLRGSPLLYTHNQLPSQPAPYALSLVLQSPTDVDEIPQTHIYRSGSQAILPIPLRGNDADQLTQEGLDLEIKKALLTAAIQADSSFPSPITVLGGDLPHTNWGDPMIVDLAMRYINTHPWIRPLGELDLLTYRRILGFERATHSTVSQEHENILAALEMAPPSPITELAWDAYWALLAPADPAYAELPELRANYLEVIDDLLTAAQWDANTGGSAMRQFESFTACAPNTDSDGGTECILASEKIFALIDSQGARLSLLFARGEDGTHQIVGPSSQFSVGLSDPSNWDLSRGPRADPDVISGGLAGPWEPYEISLIPNGLRFSSSSVQKDYLLSKDGLRVEITASAPMGVQIPLAVAPEMRFSLGWGERYFSENTPQGWVWGIESGPRVRVQTSGVLTPQTFADDLPALLVPENPNYNYPPGHFIPFPLAVPQITAQGDFWVQLDVLP